MTMPKLLLAALAIGLSGCGASETPQVNLGEEYAAQIKVYTKQFATEWANNKDEAAPSLQALLEELQAYDSHPTGGHDDTYEQLLEQVKQLQANYESATQAEIDQLKSLADTLPGDESLYQFDAD